jgi:plasmid stabilization system protein ParE
MNSKFFVKLTPSAKLDLERIIVDFYKESPGYGVKFYERVKSIFNLLEIFPKMYPKVSLAQANQKRKFLRAAFVDNYGVIYSTKNKYIVIMRIIPTKQGDAT